MKVSYTYLEHKKPSTKLAFIFPGLGYTTQAPLLYYCTSLLVKNGYDVVHVNYDYQTAPFPSFSEEEKQSCMKYNAETIMDVFHSKKYSETLLVGKSIGTLSICLSLEHFSPNKIIWLTPLINRDDVYEKMLNSHIPSLTIIGDQDPCYIDEKWELYKDAHQVLLVRGANHSLDIGVNPFESIKILEDVMSVINEFLEENDKKL